VRSNEITRTLVDIAECGDVDGVSSPCAAVPVGGDVVHPPLLNVQDVITDLASRLHPSDAAFHSLLRRVALHQIQAGERTMALHWAQAAFNSLPLMPFVSAPVVMDVAHLLNLAGGNGSSLLVSEKQGLLSKLKW
jgi:hypothetical protein